MYEKLISRLRCPGIHNCPYNPGETTCGQCQRDINAEAADAIEKLEDAIHSTPTGDPLTLEQLREMDGKPVWVECSNLRKYICPPIGWRILEKSITGHFGVWDGDNCLAERDYGADWLAYAYPPAHIDREALCGEWEGEADGYADGELVYDVWRCGDCGHVEETDDPDLLPRFCPSCGRAMTPEAWEELDKRLRG